MINFIWPAAFLALLLPPIIFFSVPRATTSGISIRVPFGDALAQGDINVTHHRGQKRRILLALAFVALTTAAARPITFADEVTIPRVGRDIMLAIDISASMSKHNWNANATRLRVVMDVIDDFIGRRSGDRIGVVVFGSRAYLQTPLTFDLEAVRQALNETSAGLAGPATALGDAVGLTIKHLRRSDANHKVLVLLSDGAANAGRVTAPEAARIAVETGLTVYTIGVASNDPHLQRKETSGSFDQSLLSRLAESTDGKFYTASSRADLQQVYQELDKLEPVPFEENPLHDVKELYPWPLGLALGLVMLLIVRHD